MPQSTRIAELLLNIGAVRLSPNKPFTWTSGLQSPIYCDNRMIFGHPQARNQVVAALTDRVRGLHIPPDVIAGTATAAIGWAALVSHELDLPFVYVRTKAKEHGAGKRVEGDIPAGKHIVVIEDLLSTGGSAISTVEALESEVKGTVSDVISIFSYEFTEAREKAMEAKVTLHPLTTVTTLLQVAVDQDRLIDEEVEMVERFIRDPKNWKGI